MTSWQISRRGYRRIMQLIRDGDQDALEAEFEAMSKDDLVEFIVYFAETFDDPHAVILRLEESLSRKFGMVH